ncbi:MAG TPA: DUF2203 domain-containing protein [Pyrinomonadaceae bacterium]|jgi:hypothetical protein|nr:DUF2203 domain-containing protein [Pyrinomonadaceae bacterium]
MKVFTLSEANELLRIVAPKLQEIKGYYSSVAEFRESAHSAAVSAELGGGGMEGGSNYVRVLYELGKLTTELHELGVQLKDYTRGLIDFPCMRDGRVILLCWQLGEGEEIEWWHEVEDGFAGRQPL